MWYLHAPDHTVPYEETFKAVDALYREGRFRRLGISNYSSCVRPASRELGLTRCAHY